MINLPKEFEARMKELLGADFEKYKKALEEEPVKAFRVNTDKISLEEFEKINPFSTDRIPYVENGFYLGAEKIGNHPFHHAGMIYVQDPGAMATAECLEIQPDWWILDMCAAPGGKSFTMAVLMENDGEIVSCDTPKNFFAGNSFYTTSANRLAGAWFPDAITWEEVAEACEEAMTKVIASLLHRSQSAESVEFFNFINRIDINLYAFHLIIQSLAYIHVYHFV